MNEQIEQRLDRRREQEGETGPLDEGRKSDDGQWRSYPPGDTSFKMVLRAARQFGVVF